MQVQLTTFHLTGIVAAFQGDFDRARSSSQAAADLLAGTRPTRLPSSGSTAAAIEGLAGRLDWARDDLVEAAAQSTKSAAIAWYQSGRFALWLADRRGLIAAIDGLEMLGIFDGWTRAMIATLKAGLSGFDGAVDEARTHYRDALRLWREVGSRPDRALALFDWAMLLGDRDDEARAAGEEAPAELTALGMAPLLARLDARQGAAQPATEAGPG